MTNPQFQIYRNAGNSITCGVEGIYAAAMLMALGKSGRETFVVAPHPTKLRKLTPERLQLLQFKLEQAEDGRWAVCQTDEQGRWSNLLYSFKGSDVAGNAAALALAIRERLFLAQVSLHKQVRLANYEVWDFWLWRQPTGREYDTPANLMRELERSVSHG